MSNNKQSSVRWILEELEKFELGTSEFYSKTAIINHADRMHKEEIMDAFQLGKWDWADNVKHGLETKDPAEYYNETFGDKQ
jgi:hypothetical protein